VPGPLAQPADAAAELWVRQVSRRRTWMAKLLSSWPTPENGTRPAPRPTPVHRLMSPALIPKRTRVTRRRPPRLELRWRSSRHARAAAYPRAGRACSSPSWPAARSFAGLARAPRCSCLAAGTRPGGRPPRITVRAKPTTQRGLRRRAAGCGRGSRYDRGRGRGRGVRGALAAAPGCRGSPPVGPEPRRTGGRRRFVVKPGALGAAGRSASWR